MIKTLLQATLLSSVLVSAGSATDLLDLASSGSSPSFGLTAPFNYEPPYPNGWLEWGLAGHKGIASWDIDGNGLEDRIDYRPYLTGSTDPDQWVQVVFNYPEGTKTVRYNITQSGDDDIIFGFAYRFLEGTASNGVKDYAIAFKRYGEDFDDPDTFKVIDITGASGVADTLPFGGFFEVAFPTVQEETVWVDDTMFPSGPRVFEDARFEYVPTEFADQRTRWEVGRSTAYLQWTSRWTLGFDLPVYTMECINQFTGIFTSCGFQQFCGLPGANPANCSVHARVDLREAGDPNPEWYSQLIARFELPCGFRVILSIYDDTGDRILVDKKSVTGSCTRTVNLAPRG